MNEIRIHNLIEQYLSGSLEESDRASLEGALLASPEARDLYWSLAATHADLREWGLGQFGMPLANLPARADASWRRWLGSSAATVAAIVVAAGSMLFAGAAWAIVPPHRLWAETRLPVGDAGFEKGRTPVTQPEGGCKLRDMLPGYGEWAADVVRITGAERGVVPVEGGKMLCFEKSLPSPGATDDVRSVSCDLFQFVDLRNHERDIATGEATLELSGCFCEPAGQRSFPIGCSVRLFLYESSPKDVGESWPDARLDAVAMTYTLDPDWKADGAWRRLSTKALVPPTAKFALITISVGVGYDPDPAAHLGRQYCDDVRLVLSVPTEAVAPAAMAATKKK